jgi:hypothetical protein
MSLQEDCPLKRDGSTCGGWLLPAVTFPCLEPALLLEICFVDDFISHLRTGCLNEKVERAKNTYGE